MGEQPEGGSGTQAQQRPTPMPVKQLCFIWSSGSRSKKIPVLLFSPALFCSFLSVSSCTWNKTLSRPGPAAQTTARGNFHGNKGTVLKSGRLLDSVSEPLTPKVCTALLQCDKQNRRAVSDDRKAANPLFTTSWKLASDLWLPQM